MSFNNEGLIENLKDWEIQLIFENDLIEIKIDCVNEELKREENKIFEEILENPNILNEIKKNIHVENNILADLELAGSGKLDIESEEYISLKNRIINVDEFKN